MNSALYSTQNYDEMETIKLDINDIMDHRWAYHHYLHHTPLLELSCKVVMQKHNLWSPRKTNQVFLEISSLSLSKQYQNEID